MPVPAFFATTSSYTFGTSTTAVLTKPTGTTVDDVMIAFLARVTGTAVTPPTDWIEIATTGDANGIAVFLYLKVATSADAGTTTYTWTLSPSSLWGGGMGTYRNVDTKEPIQGTPTTATVAAGTTINVPGQTTGEDHQIVVVLVHADGGASWTPASGFTERRDNIGAELSDMFVATSGTSTGTITATATTSRDLYGLAITLRPAKYEPNTYYRRLD